MQKLLTKVPVVLILCFISISSLLAQNKRQAYEVPSNLISVMMVPDSKCPVKATGPYKVFAYSNDEFEFGYSLINKSNVNVETISIQGWNWMGSNGFETSIEATVRQPFLGGTSRYSIWPENSMNLLPFHQNKDLQAQVSLTKNKLWIMMIIRVKLSDGTVYDVGSKYEQLDKFIASGSKVKPEDLQKWETDLREYVSKLMTAEN